MWELDYRESWVPKNWCFWTVVLEKALESLGLQGDPTSPSQRSVLGVHCKDWCWSWNSNPLATWCEELTHLKRPWCWERLRAGREGDDRGWDGWMASPTQWTWVWVDSGSWWWTGGPSVLRFMGLQRVGHNWVNEMNWYLKLKTNKDLLYTTGNSGPTVYHKDLCSIFCNNLNGKRIWEKNRYTYMCKWIGLLYTWN